MSESESEDESESDPRCFLFFFLQQAPVELNEKLSLDSFLSDSASPSDRGNSYSLKSVVHHIGSTANSGHYTADALRVRQDKSTWVSFDDGSTSETTGSAVRNSLRNQKSAYMLLYSLE